jgi:predicted Zn-dependent peptidase
MSGIYAGLDAQQIKQYLPVVTDEIKKITNEYVGDVELQRAKTQIKAGLLMGLESSFPVAEMLARQLLIYGRHYDIDEIVGQIECITKDDVLRVAQRLFSGKPSYALLGKMKNYPDYDALQNMLK